MNEDLYVAAECLNHIHDIKNGLLVKLKEANGHYAEMTVILGDIEVAQKAGEVIEEMIEKYNDVI
mgnify:CR=1 FL=1